MDDRTDLETLNDTLREVLARLEAHRPGEAGHGERVAVAAVAVGDRLGLPFESLIELRIAAALHDAGKLAVEPGLLAKEAPLDPSELEAVRRHALLSAEVAEAHALVRRVLPVLRHHHERWDGAGYPDGLAGEAIPLGARIVAVAEAFDAMTQGHPGRPPISEEEALAVLRAESGRQFDPAVVEAFLAVQPLIQPVRVA